MRSSALGRLSPEQLACALRDSRGPGMRERRWIAALATFSGMVMSGIALFQMGTVRRIPEPRWRWFDAERINGSARAYSILHTPDALLGALSYAATACLAGASGPNRAHTAPWIPVTMGAKLAADAALAAKMTAEQWTRYRAFCFWCVLSAGATFAAAALGLPETAAAMRTIRRRG